MRRIIITKTETEKQPTFKLCSDNQPKRKLLQRLSRYSDKLTKPEKIVERMLTELGVNFESQVFLRFGNDVVKPDFKIGNLIIEVQGDYWHGNPNIYSYDELDYVQKSVIERDKQKYRLYIANGYKVLYIWQSDLMNHPLLVREQLIEFLKGGDTDCSNQRLSKRLH